MTNFTIMICKRYYLPLLLLMFISSITNGQKWTFNHSSHFLTSYEGIVAYTPTKNGNGIIAINYLVSAYVNKSKLVFIDSNGEEIQEYTFPDQFNSKYIRALHYDGENIVVFFKDGGGTLIVEISEEWDIKQIIPDSQHSFFSVTPYENGYLLAQNVNNLSSNWIITGRNSSLERFFQFRGSPTASRKGLRAYPLHNGQILIVSIDEVNPWPVTYNAQCVLLNELGVEQTQFQFDSFDIGDEWPTLQINSTDTGYELIYYTREGKLIRRNYSNNHELLSIDHQELPRGLRVSKIFVHSNNRILLMGYTPKKIFAYYSDDPDVISYKDLPDKGYKIRSIHENEDQIIMLGQYQSPKSDALCLDKTNLFQDARLHLQCKIITPSGDTASVSEGWMRLQPDQGAVRINEDGKVTQLHPSNSPLIPELYYSGQWIASDTIVPDENGESEIVIFRDPIGCPKVQLHLFGEDFVIQDTNTLTLLVRNVGSEFVSNINVKLNHSPGLNLLSASIPVSQVTGNQLSWELNLSQGEDIYIHIKFDSDINMNVGQLIEYEAYVPEMDACFSTIESFSKEDALQVISTCIDNDQVRFEIKNLHQKDSVSAELDIYANSILTETQTLLLAPGEVRELTRPGMGSTWYAEIIQSTKSRFAARQSTLISGCGQTISGFPSTGFHNKHREVHYQSWHATLRRSATRYSAPKYVYTTDHILPTENPNIQQRVKSDLIKIRNESDSLQPLNSISIDFESDMVLWEPIEVIANRPIDYVVHREGRSVVIKPSDGNDFSGIDEPLLVNITYLCRSDLADLADVSMGYIYRLNYGFLSYINSVRNTDFKEINRIPPHMNTLYPILVDGANMFYEIENIQSLKSVIPDSKGGYVAMFESSAFNTKGINEWIVMRIDKAQRYRWHQSLNILDVNWIDHFLIMGQNDELLIFTREKFNSSEWSISSDVPRYFRIDTNGKMTSGQLEWEDPSFRDYRILQATKVGEHPIFIALNEDNIRIIGRANSDLKLKHLKTLPQLEDRIVRSSILGNIHDTLVLEIVYNSDFDNSYYTEIQYLDNNFDILKTDILENSQNRFWLNQNSGLFRILSTPSETNNSHAIGFHTLNDTLQWFDFPDERSFVLRDQTPWNDGFITTILNFNNHLSFDLSKWYINTDTLEKLATYSFSVPTKHLNVHCPTHSKDKLMVFNHVASNNDVQLFYSSYFQPDFSSSVINKEKDRTSILKIHPNPSRSFFNITHFFDQAVTVSIFNTQGQLMHHSSYQGNPIEIQIPSSWNPGVYHVRLTSSTNNYQYGKLIIEP